MRTRTKERKAEETPLERPPNNLAELTRWAENFVRHVFDRRKQAPRVCLLQDADAEGVYVIKLSTRLENREDLRETEEALRGLAKSTDAKRMVWVFDAATAKNTHLYDEEEAISLMAADEKQTFLLKMPILSRGPFENYLGPLSRSSLRPRLAMHTVFRSET